MNEIKCIFYSLLKEIISEVPWGYSVFWVFMPLDTFRHPLQGHTTAVDQTCDVLLVTQILPCGTRALWSGPQILCGMLQWARILPSSHLFNSWWPVRHSWLFFFGLPQDLPPYISSLIMMSLVLSDKTDISVVLTMCYDHWQLLLQVFLGLLVLGNSENLCCGIIVSCPWVPTWYNVCVYLLIYFLFFHFCGFDFCSALWLPYLKWEWSQEWNTICLLDCVLSWSWPDSHWCWCGSFCVSINSVQQTYCPWSGTPVSQGRNTVGRF